MEMFCDGYISTEIILLEMFRCRTPEFEGPLSSGNKKKNSRSNWWLRDIGRSTTDRARIPVGRTPCTPRVPSLAFRNIRRNSGPKMTEHLSNAYCTLHAQVTRPSRSALLPPNNTDFASGKHQNRNARVESTGYRISARSRQRSELLSVISCTRSRARTARKTACLSICSRTHTRR